MGTSTINNLIGYHKNRRGVGDMELYETETIYAGNLGYINAAPTVSGVTNVWQGVQVIPLNTADEIHYAWNTPHNLNTKEPIYIRFGVIEANADDTLDITLTVDRVSAGDAAADGATSMTDTIPQITTGANKVALSYWAKINGYASTFDYLFIKAIAATTNEDGSKVWCLQIAWKPLTK